MVWSSSKSKVEAGGGAASLKMLTVSSAAHSTQVNLNFQENKDLTAKEMQTGKTQDL